jgi:hypothetical protein
MLLAPAAPQKKIAGKDGYFEEGVSGVHSRYRLMGGEDDVQHVVLCAGRLQHALVDAGVLH